MESKAWQLPGTEGVMLRHLSPVVSPLSPAPRARLTSDWCINVLFCGTFSRIQMHTRPSDPSV